MPSRLSLFCHPVFSYFPRICHYMQGSSSCKWKCIHQVVFLPFLSRRILNMARNFLDMIYRSKWRFSVILPVQSNKCVGGSVAVHTSRKHLRSHRRTNGRISSVFGDVIRITPTVLILVYRGTSGTCVVCSHFLKSFLNFSSWVLLW
jgi:hypothetical protein